MFHQRHEARFATPITTVFASVLQVLARRRWAAEPWFDGADPNPPVGRRYVYRNGSLLRRGRVVECLRPVLLTLYESLIDPPCRVRLRLRWRLEPLDTRTSVLLDARYELNGPAYLNRRHWREQIHGHCGRLLMAVQVRLVDAEVSQGVAAVSGQKIGSRAMTVTNTMSVNGKPSFK